jgi:hypothetical protein
MRFGVWVALHHRVVLNAWFSPTSMFLTVVWLVLFIARQKHDAIFEALLRLGNVDAVITAVDSAKDKLAVGTSAAVAVIKAALAKPGAGAGDEARNNAASEAITAHAELLKHCGAPSAIQGLRTCDNELQHPAGEPREVVVCCCANMLLFLSPS